MRTRPVLYEAENEAEGKSKRPSRKKDHCQFKGSCFRPETKDTVSLRLVYGVQ